VQSSVHLASVVFTTMMSIDSALEGYEVPPVLPNDLQGLCVTIIPRMPGRRWSNRTRSARR
jgi:hypothetical protein